MSKKIQIKIKGVTSYEKFLNFILSSIMPIMNNHKRTKNRWATKSIIRSFRLGKENGI